jgi:hypothetical protein
LTVNDKRSGPTPVELAHPQFNLRKLILVRTHRGQLE